MCSRSSAAFGLLAYLAALLLIPSEDSPAAAGTAPGRNRWLVIAGVVVLLLVTWPFLLGGGLLLAGFSSRSPFWSPPVFSSGGSSREKGPGDDAGDIAKRAALGIGILILCGLIAIAARGRRPRAARRSWRSR